MQLPELEFVSIIGQFTQGTIKSAPSCWRQILLEFIDETQKAQFGSSEESLDYVSDLSLPRLNDAGVNRLVQRCRRPAQDIPGHAKREILTLRHVPRH
ncbi:hypothetical protein [Ensifer aridi]|uniref:hypothetical protein n=1 Tax=Ensifer aridi TaxID=1708715 RepID=UPI00358F3D20